MRSLEERLKMLESQVRRWRLMTFAFVICCAAALLLGAVPDNPKQLAVEKLVVTDGAGKARIELKYDDRNNQHGYGLFFLDDQGQLLGSLAVPVNSLVLRMEESPQKRRASTAAALEEMERLYAADKKKQLDWQISKKELLDQNNKAGPRSTIISASGLFLSDLTEGDVSFSRLGSDGLGTPRIAVRKGIAATIPQPGTIDIEDGALIVRESSNKHTAVLGRTKLIHPKTGAETELKASSLTLFDNEGKVSFRAP